MESMMTGSYTIGLRSNTHVVLGCVNKPPSELSPLQRKIFKKVDDHIGELSSRQKKIFKVDDYIGVAISGLIADGRVLSQYMRSKCINYTYSYECPLPVRGLVDQLRDEAQACTQTLWKQPYGVGLLVGGFDESGTHLYYNSPDGKYFEYQAFAIGSSSQATKELLERRFQTLKDASREDLIKHALFAIRETMQGEKLKSSTCGIAVVGIEEAFHILDQQTVDDLITSFELVDEEAGCRAAA